MRRRDTVYPYSIDVINMGNKRSSAGCQAPPPTPNVPTVRQVAARLLATMDNLHAGTETTNFHGWENGLGNPAGDALEDVRIKVCARDDPRLARRAGEQDLQLVAEAVWTAAFREARRAGRAPAADETWKG